MSHRHGKIGLSLRLAALLLAGALGAAEVGEVKFEQSGTDKLTEAQLALNIRLRKGAEYRREILDEDIRSLYRTGNFADVQAAADYLSRDKVRITFHLRLKERVSRVEIRGNKKFKTGDLGKLVTVAEGGLLNSVELRKSAAALRKFYHDRGYRDAVVTPAFVVETSE